MQTYIYTLLSLLVTNCLAIPTPESVGADGDCSDPVITLKTVDKQKLGPYLVSGARADANPNGGGASFTKTYSVSLSHTVTAGLGLDADNDFTKVLTLGLDLNAGFSITRTTGTSVGVNTICPTNTQSPYNVTWGLVHWDYEWHVTGNKFYPQGFDPMMRNCAGKVADDQKAGDHYFEATYPATQQGSQDGADAEVEFQCCTDSRGNSYPGSPVCPNAS